ncbi:MAG: DUF4465 domain-containing protein [Saprospiraceae bacterium]
MTYKITLILCLALSFQTTAQDTIDFESFKLLPGKFLNGSDAPGFFEEANLVLPNAYNKDWMAWSGWSISSMQDTITAGFTNEYSAISGAGADRSISYAVAYVATGENLLKVNDAENRFISGFYVNNTTYAYLSMKNGDAFAKKFGGVTGNDPDFFKLTVKAYRGGVISENQVDVMLADYRGTDNAQDYILKEWKYVDISSLGLNDSLSLKLTSSDNGAFGMNTPAYFCIDKVAMGFTVRYEDLTSNLPTKLTFSPNPTSGEVLFKINDQIINDQTLLIYNQNGTLVAQKKAINGLVDFSDFNDNVYFIKDESNNNQSAMIIKM